MLMPLVPILTVPLNALVILATMEMVLHVLIVTSVQQMVLVQPMQLVPILTVHSNVHVILVTMETEPHVPMLMSVLTMVVAVMQLVPTPLVLSNVSVLTDSRALLALILMNVLLHHVQLMPLVLILMVASSVPVTQDMPVMGSHAVSLKFVKSFLIWIKVTTTNVLLVFPNVIWQMVSVSILSVHTLVAASPDSMEMVKHVLMLTSAS